jgi:hypothetical protein
MEQCHLIYIFIACVVVAMLLDVGFFLLNKKNEMRKMKTIAREIRRSGF